MGIGPVPATAKALAEQAKAVSYISYLNQSGPQLKPDLMVCFDLELPEDFTPRANHGEVHSFELWPVRRVFETVRDTSEFKYNCNLVLIDFFVQAPGQGGLERGAELVPVEVEGVRGTRFVLRDEVDLLARLLA